MMKGMLAGIVGIFLLAHPASAKPLSPLDVEAIGRLHNLSYDPINDVDDLLGHGRITARFQIFRFLHGTTASRSITIQYVAHTYMGEDHLIRLKLRARPDGIYQVCAKPDGEGLRCGETR